MTNALNESMDLLLFIVNPDKGQTVINLAYKKGIRAGTILLGLGTVRNSILKKLGLDNSHKEIVLLLAPRHKAKETMDYISEVKNLNKKNFGIAFRTSISNFLGVSKHLVDFGQVPEEDQLEGEEEIMYQAIVTIVDQGDGRDVMRVAEDKGANGGTFIKARGAGSAEAKRVFNIEIEPEKEILLIIAKKENTPDITQAISDHLNIDERNAGILFTVDLSETRGLFGWTISTCSEKN